MRLKCQRAETGQRGVGKVKSEMSAPRAKRSVFDIGRNSEAVERSGAKDRCAPSSVAGEKVDEEGQEYSDERRRPKKADDKAAQRARASCGGK